AGTLAPAAPAPAVAAVRGAPAALSAPGVPALGGPVDARGEAAYEVAVASAAGLGYDLDGWVSPATLVRAAWDAVLRSASLAAAGGTASAAGWEIRHATVVFEGELPRVDEPLRFAVVAGSPAPDGTAGFSVRCHAGPRPVLSVPDGVAGPRAAVPVGAPLGMAEPDPVPTILAFKPLAYTPRTALGPAELARLSGGDVPGVFGSSYEQRGCNTSLRLPPAGFLLLDEVTEIARTGGARNLGRLRARGRLAAGDAVSAVTVLEAAWQAAQTLALYLGLQLCLPDARFDVCLPDSNIDLDPEVAHWAVDVFAGGWDAGCELVADVTVAGLAPRPRIRLDTEFRGAGGVLARVSGLYLQLREKPGTLVAPLRGGAVPGFLGRVNSAGEAAMINEMHMANSAHGYLDVALGPEFAPYLGRRATRLPGGGLSLVDRVMIVDGQRGELSGGATAWTEYDVPADAWYYQEYASPTMPNIVHMETSLQSALFLGYYLGATLTGPDEDYSLRNLDGEATLLRQVDLRGRTIRQVSTLLSTTVMVGAVLQNFSYELSVDGEPFYRGESLFGFFNATALANQNGLDSGACVPTWLETAEVAPGAVRTIDVAGRRDAGAPLSSRGHLAMLDSVQVVDGGGRFGKGYLRAVRPVDPSDWFFALHFWLDPVMPGSLGVEAVIQAMQEWLVDSGLAADLVEPRFVLPTDLSMSWRYRGQILPTDGEMTLEVHLKEVRRGVERVRVVGDASVWKPGMRIYALTDIAVELHGVGAGPW
ncbi:beta-ketoacyl synthase, partial [Frankia sp. Cj5]|uniref:beta-ketoacyl synthase n=1 Tax=Frankia sp. Cj5 TaxID=2880978 RepID=UPI001EF73823